MMADYGFHGDTYRHLVLWATVRGQIASGSWPVWVPQLAGGFPVWASFQWGLASPLFVLFLWLPVETAYSVSAAIHFILAGCGAYALARRLAGGHWGGLVACITYAFSSFFVGRLAAGHIFLIWPMAWLPWALWFFDRALVRPSSARVILAVLFLSLALISGHVQMTVYVAGAFAAWFVARLSLQGGSPARLRSAGTALAVGLLSLGLTAVQWLPFVELLQSTHGTTWPEEQLAMASLPPRALGTFLLPHLFGVRREGTHFGSVLDHELLCFSNAAVVWLALLGLRVGRRSWTVVLLALALAGVVAALGTHSPVHHFATWLVPPLAKSRTPGRALAWTLLAACLLAARGAKACGRRVRRGEAVRGPLLLGALVGALAVAAAWHVGSPTARAVLPSTRYGAVILRSVLGALVPLAALLASLWWAARARRPALWGWSLVSVLLASSLIEGARSIEPLPAQRLYTAPPERIERADPHTFRVMDVMSYSNAAVHGLEVTGNNIVSVLEPAEYQQFWTLLSPQRAAVANVGFVHVRAPAVAWRKRFADDVWEKLPVRGLPRARLYRRVCRMPDTTSALAGIDSGRIDIHQTLILDGQAQTEYGPHESDPHGAAVDGEEGSVRLLDYRPGNIRLEVVNRDNCWLYLAEKFAPGWRARLDGKPIQIARAFVAFQAVRVPPGRSVVELTYCPSSLGWGALLSGMSAAAALALLVANLIRRRAFMIRALGRVAASRKTSAASEST